MTQDTPSTSDRPDASGEKVGLTIAYDGKPKTFAGPPNQPLRAIFNQALSDFGVTGSDRDNHVLDHEGNVLNLDQKLRDLDLPEDATLILRARRAGGGNKSPPLIVPPPAREATHQHFRGCGSQGWECVALWATSRNGSRPARIDRVFHPDHGASGGYYEIDGHELGRIHRELLADDLKLVAQVHTHPGPAFHSERDDQGPAIHTPGFLSIVVPEFGRRGLGPNRGLYVTDYTGDGSWRKLSDTDQKIRLQWEGLDE